MTPSSKVRIATAAIEGRAGSLRTADSRTHSRNRGAPVSAGMPAYRGRWSRTLHLRESDVPDARIQHEHTQVVARAVRWQHEESDAFGAIVQRRPLDYLVVEKRDLDSSARAGLRNASCLDV